MRTLVECGTSDDLYSLAAPTFTGFHRLRISWEIRDDIHEAFLTLGCALLCRRRLNSAVAR
ncbi:hypothetical protein [Streptomyces sp. NPDC050528]|uniref:hypothetical protein n=1 Tax=unclassified Streptomyces TaxID=2593676 RepID=UPI00379861E9